jgi:putative FmdB family regulatory protein
MPIYEYQCNECSERHEAIQSIHDADLTDCPKCGKPGLKRLISAAGFRLKGGGWYETDFKSGNKKNVAGDGGGSGGDSSASGDSSAPKSTGTDD